MSDTIRKGIIDLAIYQNGEKELMLGNLSALVGKYVEGFSLKICLV